MVSPTTPNRKKIRNSTEISALPASLVFHDDNVNGTTMQLHVSDVELLAMKSETYTSLRDLLPAVTSPATSSIMSPAHNSSWQELPIKNPLVKQAAMSYLQPMSSAPAPAGGEGLLGGCLSWLNEVVLSRLRWVFRGRDEEEEEDSIGDDKEE